MIDKEIYEKALVYHSAEPPGKMAIVATKSMATQQDLALAYSPGVAAPCEEIARDPTEANRYTARGNLVGVVTNGTAVLGLGAIGALASKPVMEGKAVLFKKFSNIDVFDIEVEERDPKKFIEIVAGLEATFGGINLEDIKAPECFEIEKALRKRMKIPVFHDDQHGTAIVSCSAILSGLRVVGKDISEVKLVASGAGAAALACLDLIVSLGLKKENIIVCDRTGVIHTARDADMDPYKARYAIETDDRTLSDAIKGADIFLGLSAPGALTQSMVKDMADKPIIMALANPTPEILPEQVLEVRSDAIICTGRSDYPNQVNNVLCFPFIFRGALDVAATTINEEMKHACVRALSDLTMAEPSDIVKNAYGGESLKFGPDYVIPKPFDPRLIVEVSSAVAAAAMASGVALRPIEDMQAYRKKLNSFVFRSGNLMKPIFEQAAQNPQRVIYAEGEDDRVLQTVQQVVNEGLAKPILIGRPEVIENKLNSLALKIKAGVDFEIVDLHNEEVLRRASDEYFCLMRRNGVSPSEADAIVRGQTTAIAALMLRRGDADAMICGAVGRFRHHFLHVSELIGKREGVHELSTLGVIIMPHGTYFITDTNVTPNPTAYDIAEMTQLAAEEVLSFGVKPKVALLSHSTFGSHNTESSRKMREAKILLKQRCPDLEVEGELQGHAALSQQVRDNFYPNSELKGRANLLVMPNIDAANIAYNLLKMTSGGVTVGPIMLGAAQPVHVMSRSVSVRGLINITALAVVQAQR